MSRARWNVQYYQRVLATDPIAYWLLDEKQGTISYDRVSGRVAGVQNGAYTGVTLAQAGIGDGRASGLYDGANDYDDIFSASFAAAFDGSEGSALIWMRVANAGVWADAATRAGCTFWVNADNRVVLEKSPLANALQYTYVAGGVTDTLILGGQTSTAWFSMLSTWSSTDDNFRAYLNGAEIAGSPSAGLGVWAGVIPNTRTVIGARITTPSNVWDGYLAHCAVWDRALTPAEIAALAVIE